MDKIKKLMNNFYYDEVILSNDQVTELREKKNINIILSYSILIVLIVKINFLVQICIL